MFKSTEIDQLYHDIFKFKIKTITVNVETFFLIISKEVVLINHTKNRKEIRILYAIGVF